MRQLGALVALTALVLHVAAGAAAGQAQTFTVTVEDRTDEHPSDQGYSEVYAIDGVQGKELTLVKGKTYVFRMNDIPSIHPFYLTTSRVGLGAETFGEGVEGNEATGNEELVFTPPQSAPDSLWYQCTIHRYMGWRMALVVATASTTVNADETESFPDTGVRIRFSGTSGIDDVTVHKFNNAPAEHEGISESTVSAYRFTMEAGDNLQFGAGTEVRFDVGTLSGLSDASSVTVYRRDPAGSEAFSPLPTTYDAAANELVVTTGELGGFVFASESEPLPVELVQFGAQLDGEAVALAWRTASEVRNAGFEVQRRKPGAGSWTTLGFVEGTGSARSGPARYRFRDDALPYEADRVAYRLRQIDTDGAVHVTDTVHVALDAPRRVALHAPRPNPTANRATIRYELPHPTDVRLALYNALGQRVATLARGRQPPGRTDVQVDASQLASGSYLVRLAVDGQVRIRSLKVLQ